MAVCAVNEAHVPLVLGWSVCSVCFLHVRIEGTSCCRSNPAALEKKVRPPVSSRAAVTKAAGRAKKVQHHHFGNVPWKICGARLATHSRRTSKDTLPHPTQSASMHPLAGQSYVLSPSTPTLIHPVHLASHRQRRTLRLHMFAGPHLLISARSSSKLPCIFDAAF
jgi:hypothetical protein